MNESTASFSSPKERMKNELTLLMRSGYPYLFLVSYEDDRAIETVREIGKTLGREVFIWSSTSGLFPASSPIPYLSQPQLLSQGLGDIDRYNGAALFVVLDAHNHLDSPDVTRMLRNFADNLAHVLKRLFS